MGLFKHYGNSRLRSQTHYTKPKRYGYVEIGEPVYLRRWYLWRCKWFSIRLHNIIGPDPDPDPHDHPWNFLSVPLRGSYVENRYSGHWAHRTIREHKVRLFSFHKATDAHKIMRLRGKRGVWTFFLTGPETRKWGFWTAKGWLTWNQYLGVPETVPRTNKRGKVE